MHRESILMYRRRSGIASRYSYIVEEHVFRVNIHASWSFMHRKLYPASRKDIHTPQNLCITRRIHASSKFMHREKISYLAETHASREDPMPHQNLYVARKFHTSLKFMQRERISSLAESYTSWENFISRRNLRIAGRYPYPAKRHV